MPPRFKLSLFVTPDSSGKALSHLYRALENLAYTDYELRIIDVLENPERAREAKIVGTPALVYHAPGGEVLIHKISDIDAVRNAMGIE